VRRTWSLAALLVLVLVAAAVVALVRWRTPPPHRIFFGVDVPSSRHADAQRFGAKVGYAPSVQNIFVKLDSSFTVATLQELGQDGVEPMISLEPWAIASRWTGKPMPQYRLAALTSGRYDAQLEAIGAVLKDYGKPVLLRFAHEMNGGWYPWAESVNGNRPGDYVAAWRHVYALLRAGNAEVRMIWAPNAIGKASPGSSLPELYPGDRWVDAVGLTGYGHGNSATASLEPTFRALTALTHRPVILAETGADGSGKLAWLRSLGPFLTAHPSIEGFVWFDTTVATTGASGDYAISTPAEASAFHQMLGSVKLTAASS
jgi:hypothetical protein